MRRKRRCYGALSAELPVAMWFLFMVVTVPMLNLATIGLRQSFFVSGCREAAHRAARSQTFTAAIDADHPSSAQAATAKVNQAIGQFNGIQVTSVATNIVITNIKTGQTTRQSTVLTSPADTSSNTYSIEVMLIGQTAPLVPVNGSVLGSIPGLTAPITMTCASQEYCEYPGGLNQ